MERLTMKKLNDMTLDDFLKLPYSNPDIEQTFNSVIIVPLPEAHDSGFSLMKLILIDSGELVGVIGGCTDVIMLLSRSPYSWNIDCLNQTKCIRLFTSAKCRSINGSSVIISASEMG